VSEGVAFIHQFCRKLVPIWQDEIG
jgi:hypothetical protein